MKPMLKVILTVGAGFALTFLVLRLGGWLTADDVEAWLTHARHASPMWVGALVVGLLFADLFVSVPTMSTTMLAGYFLGFGWGASTAFVGLFLAGVVGYGLSKRYGERLLDVILRDPDEREQLESTFRDMGFLMIVLSRAVPILPEVTACLAGMTGMRFSRFLLAWVISTVPYVAIAAYGGSVSTVDDPKPAIITAVLLAGTLWGAWFLVVRRRRRSSPVERS